MKRSAFLGIFLIALTVVSLGVSLVQPSANFSQVAKAATKKDKKKPKITMKGKTKITVTKGKSIKIPKVTAKDNKDGNVTKRIKVTVKKGKTSYKSIAKKIKSNKKVTFKATGTYTVTYTVKDKAGNKATKKRKIVVKKAKKENETTTPTSTPAPTPVPEKTITGDGFTLKNGLLKITKIMYSVEEVAGNEYYVYDTPWNDYIEEVTVLEIDADMERKSSDADTKESTKTTKKTGSTGTLFGNMPQLQMIIVKRLNLDGIKDISSMFCNNPQLKSISIIRMDSSNVENMSYMLGGNEALIQADLSGMDTSSVTNMTDVFRNCKSLISMDVSSFDTSKVEDFSHMFEGCSLLISPELGNFVINNADVSAMFASCASLESVNIGEVTLTTSTPAATMFDGINRITSYEFADHWTVGEEIFPISENCYIAYPYIVETPYGPIIVKEIGYIKRMPDWYKKNVEALEAAQDMYHVISLPLFDVYMTEIRSGCEYILDPEDFLKIMMDAVLEYAIKPNLSPELAGDVEYAKKLIELVCAIIEADDGEDYINLLTMSLDELNTVYEEIKAQQ